MSSKRVWLLPAVLGLTISACGVPATQPTASTLPLAAIQTGALPAISPSPAIGSPSPTPSPHGLAINFDRSVSIPNGYALYGHLSWNDPLIPYYGAIAQLESATDADGATLPFELADLDTYPAQGERLTYWAYRLTGINPSWPLTMSFVVQASFPASGGSFTFDPGPRPRLGQVWEINQDVTVSGETIHVISAEEAGIEEGFFLFTMQSDSNIVGAVITDLAHPPVGGGGGGGEIPEAGAPFQTGFGYQIPIPAGPLTLTFTRLGVIIPGDWTLTWNGPHAQP